MIKKLEEHKQKNMNPEHRDRAQKMLQAKIKNKTNSVVADANEKAC